MLFISDKCYSDYQCCPDNSPNSTYLPAISSQTVLFLSFQSITTTITRLERFVSVPSSLDPWSASSVQEPIASKSSTATVKGITATAPPLFPSLFWWLLCLLQLAFCSSCDPSKVNFISSLFLPLSDPPWACTLKSQDTTPPHPTPAFQPLFPPSAFSLLGLSVSTNLICSSGNLVLPF